MDYTYTFECIVNTMPNSDLRKALDEANSDENRKELSTSEFEIFKQKGEELVKNDICTQEELDRALTRCKKHVDYINGYNDYKAEKKALARRDFMGIAEGMGVIGAFCGVIPGLGCADYSGVKGCKGKLGRLASSLVRWTLAGCAFGAVVGSITMGIPIAVEEGNVNRYTYECERYGAHARNK